MLEAKAAVEAMQAGASPTAPPDIGGDLEKHGPYMAWGGYGQICYIHPDYETVIVKFSGHRTSAGELGKLEMYACGQIAEAVGG